MDDFFFIIFKVLPTVSSKYLQKKMVYLYSCSFNLYLVKDISSQIIDINLIVSGTAKL